MTTDTEALICDCPAKNMPFGRCCKLEPLTALRAAFESTVSEWGWDTYRNKAGDYATTSTNGAWAGYQAGHAAAKTEASWIPEAVLPTPGMKVIATYVNALGNRRTIMAKWVAAKTVEAFSLDDEFGEYDEATDTTYVPQGWYEIINNWDDCPLVAVHEGAITHWMPLPASPDAIRAEPKEPSDG